MFCYVTTGAITGLRCDLIRVEVDFSPGLPCFQMVGYLAGEVREARERVRVALRNSGHTLPASAININLSPASIRKSGTSYDLPIAAGLLAASGVIPEDSLKDTLIIGELGLDGDVRGVRGILPIVREAAGRGITRVILPRVNLSEGALIPDIRVIGVDSLKELCSLLKNSDAETVEADSASGSNVDGDTDTLASGAKTHADIQENAGTRSHISIEERLLQGDKNAPDFADVHGQDTIKRAAMVAAAGFHHMLMVGPPGSGKTMIAKRIPSIMPPLTADEALEVTSIYSVAGALRDDEPLILTRPCVSPHHTITEQALAGGGIYPRPGAVSLAHRGVLFIDEMTEFSRTTLDIMRQPLEDKRIQIVRNSGSFTYPADFMLVAACNPCPCGYYPDMNKCRCSEQQVRRYLSRISGPLLDRIDICCDAEPVNLSDMQSGDKAGLSSSDMRARIMSARDRQSHRFAGSNINFNSEMAERDIEVHCKLGAPEQLLMRSAYETLGLSARSYHRILKVARTIADLSDSDDIREEHISEAVYYRTSGARYWGR